MCPTAAVAVRKSLKGLLREAKGLAQENVQALSGYAERGVPVVGLEPSCVTAFVDDYRDLVPGEATDRVAQNVKMIDQFLAKEWTSGKLEPAKIFHQNGTPYDVPRALSAAGGDWLEPLQSRARLGLRKRFPKSIQAAAAWRARSATAITMCRWRWASAVCFPRLRAHEGEVVACGFSCRHQIKDGADRQSQARR